MSKLIDGLVSPVRRKFAEQTGSIVLADDWLDVGKYRKTAVTYAAKMNEPFTVNTLEGVMDGKVGDYLAVGTRGELYPIDAAIFEESYERWKQGDPE